MSITLLFGNTVINKWGYSASENGIRSNTTVGGSNDFVCVTDEGNDTLSFDIHIRPDCGEASLLSMQERYDRLAHTVSLANRYGHMQYRYIFNDSMRVWEVQSASIGQKDQQNKYAARGSMTAELQLTVRKSAIPTIQLFPTRVVPANAATFATMWANDPVALLVTPESTLFTEWPVATTLGSVSALHEISNTNYTQLTLTGPEQIDDVLFPVQPIVSLLPRIQNDTGRVGVVATDLLWLNIAVGDSIGGIVIADASDNIIAWIPYTNWAYGDAFHGAISPDGGAIKFKVNQFGLVIAP